MKNILYSVFLIILFISCKRNDSGSCLYSYQPPNSFFFIIKTGGQSLPNNILDSIKISYTENSIKKYITDLSYAVDYYANKGILVTRNIGSTSGDSGITTFYLEFSNKLKTDTLYINFTKPAVSNGCVYVLNEVKYNNKVSGIDSAFKYQPVYLFDKQ